MLKVIPKKWSYAFSVTDGTKAVAQAVNLSWWRDQSELRVRNEIYTARRSRSSYVLESPSGVLARAERPRRWCADLVIDHSGHQYTLRAKSMFRRQLLLLEDATHIGTLSPEGIFTRRATVKLPQTFPLFLQVFIVWLAMTRWKHEDYAAATVATGSTGG